MVLVSCICNRQLTGANFVFFLWTVSFVSLRHRNAAFYKRRKQKRGWKHSRLVLTPLSPGTKRCVHVQTYLAHTVIWVLYSFLVGVFHKPTYPVYSRGYSSITRFSGVLDQILGPEWTLGARCGNQQLDQLQPTRSDQASVTSVLEGRGSLPGWIGGFFLFFFTSNYML